MIVGASLAPIAVLIFVLYASFWNVVALICPSGFFLLNRSTAPCRTPSWGCPFRNQNVAPAPPPPGPDVPQADRAAIDSGRLAAKPRTARREIGVSTLNSVPETRRKFRGFLRKLSKSAIS